LDRIPLFRKSKFTIKDAQKYLGFFGDSMIMGLVIGMVIGALAGYDIKAVLQLVVSMCAVLVLIPEMTSLSMEGLMPISDA
ncbi:PTS transporter subunit IIC, partial [Enterococcus faecalis]|uniref:PTS transporter subunit IIC n=1 Tax=Enterococcus faecalis TaxID=1351 RepID=UPI003D6B4DD3